MFDRCSLGKPRGSRSEDIHERVTELGLEALELDLRLGRDPGSHVNGLGLEDIVVSVDGAGVELVELEVGGELVGDLRDHCTY